MRLLGWLVVAAVATRALVACGGDDSSVPGSPDGGSGGTEPDAAKPKDDGSTPVIDSGALVDSGVTNSSDADADAGTVVEDAGDAGPLPPGAHLAVGVGSCAIDAAGALACWGSGYLATGPITPTVIAPGTTWNEIAAGRQYCGIQTDGSLWCWTPGDQPSQPDTSKFIHVTAGHNHNCAITPGRALYCWGSNSNGQLGLGDENSHDGLQRVGTDNDWASVSAGDDYTCAIKQSGALFCWGDNTWGQVSSGPSYRDVTSPDEIMHGTIWLEVSAGDDNTCARRNDGVLFCWGTLGDAQNMPPKQIDLATDWTHTSAHGGHDCTLKSSGALYCFGGNTYGQIGVPGAGYNKLTLVPGTWSDVATGGNTTCARKTDGSIWCWGEGNYGQLGIGAPYGPHLSPAQVAGTWKAVSAGNVTTCGVRGDGTIACWGLTASLAPSAGFVAQAPVTVDTGTSWDMLALSTNESICARKTDTSLWCRSSSGPFTATGLNVTRFANTDSHQCAITTAGALYCWGQNDKGQLGLPLDAGTSITSPTQIGTDTWIDIAVDYANTCGIRTDGTLWCWGNGNPTMVQVGTSAKWSSISMASGSRVGVNDGGLYSWNASSTPTQLGTATDWASAAAGVFSSCATKTDGTLDCFGGGGFSGELGDGTTTGHALPAPVAGGATNWAAASVGVNLFACGLRTDGTLYCWGDNGWGNVGDNSMFVTVPTQVLP